MHVQVSPSCRVICSKLTCLLRDKDDLANETGLSRKEVRNAVEKLKENNLIDYIAKPKGNSKRDYKYIKCGGS